MASCFVARMQKEQEVLARAKDKHDADRTFVEGKKEIEYLYDIGRTLQNEFNPRRKHDSFYEFQTVSTVMFPSSPPAVPCTAEQRTQHNVKSAFLIFLGVARTLS